MGGETARERMRRFFKKRKTDRVFRAATSGVLSLAATAAFALYNGYFGVSERSVWHGSICLFYLLLCAIRGVVLSGAGRARRAGGSDRPRISRAVFLLSSCLLLLLDLLLILPVSLLVRLQRPVSMGIIPAIATAVYTTYKITAAVIGFARRSRGGFDPLADELQTIRLIDALVSVLSLQNTLITVNLPQKGDARSLLTLSAVSGAVIYLIILFVTVQMIVSGARAYRGRPPASHDKKRR